eukprot:336442-Chlamydomonas_euryale.AAC.3
MTLSSHWAIGRPAFRKVASIWSPHSAAWLYKAFMHAPRLGMVGGRSPQPSPPSVNLSPSSRRPKPCMAHAHSPSHTNLGQRALWRRSCELARRVL